MKIIKSLILISVFLLTACNDGFFDRNSLTSSDIFERGWAKKNNRKKDNEKLYCYRTIGGVDCFKEPQENRENSIIVDWIICKIFLNRLILLCNQQDT